MVIVLVYDTNGTSILVTTFNFFRTNYRTGYYCVQVGPNQNLQTCSSRYHCLTRNTGTCYNKLGCYLIVTLRFSGINWAW